MDLVTWVVFFISFVVCAIFVYLVSVYGTSEQTFEEGLIKKSDKKKEHKASRKDKEEEVRKRTPRSNKKSQEEEEPDVQAKAIKIPPKSQKKNALEPGKDPARKKVPHQDPTKEKLIETVTTTEDVITAAPAPKVEVAKKKEDIPVPKAPKATKMVIKEVNGLGSSIEEIEIKPTKAAPKLNSVEPKIESPEVKKEVAEPKKETQKIAEVKKEAPKPVEPKKEVAKPVEPKKEAAKVVEAKIEPEATKVVVEPASEPAKVDDVKQKSDDDKQVIANSGPISKPQKKKESSGPKLADANSLMAAVRTVSLEEKQLQQLIDILLNKQNSAKTSLNGTKDEWVGDKNTDKMAALKRQLTETQQSLEEKTNMTKYLTEKLETIRTELSQSKVVLKNEQKKNSDFQTQNQQTITGLESRLKQEIETRKRETDQLQSQVAMHLNNVKSLQANIETLQQREKEHNHMDVGLLQKLGETKAGLEVELTKVKSELAVALGHLEEANGARQKVVEELASAQELLKYQYSQKEAELLSEHNAKVEELEKQNRELESTIGKLKSSIEVGQAELQAQVQVHAHQQTSSKQLSAFDHSAYSKEQSRVSSEIEALLKSDNFVVEKSLAELFTKDDESSDFKLEKILAKGDVMIAKLSECYVTVSSNLTKVESELEAQRLKNNELRQKNWKAVEALNNAEQSFQKRLKATANSPSDSDIKGLREEIYKEVQKSLVTSFPVAIDADSSAFETWLPKYIQQLQRTSFNEEKEALEKKTKLYQTILAQTEQTLQELQTSVESTESGYLKKISEFETKVNQLAKEETQLQQKNSTLDANLKAYIKDLEEKKSDLANEQKAKAELSEQIARLQVMLSTNQKALDQEKRTSEKLLLQLADKKADSLHPSCRVTPLSDDSSDEGGEKGSPTKPFVPVTVGLGMHVKWDRVESKAGESIENGNSNLTQGETETPQSGSVASLEMSENGSISTPVKSKKSKKKKNNVA